MTFQGTLFLPFLFLELQPSRKKNKKVSKIEIKQEDGKKYSHFFSFVRGLKSA